MGLQVDMTAIIVVFLCCRCRGEWQSEIFERRDVVILSRSARHGASWSCC